MSCYLKDFYPICENGSRGKLTHHQHTHDRAFSSKTAKIKRKIHYYWKCMKDEERKFPGDSNHIGLRCKN